MYDNIVSLALIFYSVELRESYQLAQQYQTVQTIIYAIYHFVCSISSAKRSSISPEIEKPIYAEACLSSWIRALWSTVPFS